MVAPKRPFKLLPEDFEIVRFLAGDAAERVQAKIDTSKTPEERAFYERYRRGL